jgi:hypothetical protein
MNDKSNLIKASLFGKEIIVQRSDNGRILATEKIRDGNLQLALRIALRDGLARFDVFEPKQKVDEDCDIPPS